MINFVIGLLCVLSVFCLRLLWDICKLERRVKDLEDKNIAAAIRALKEDGDA